MSHPITDTNPTIDQLPFKVQKKDNYLELLAKPASNISRKKKKIYEDNRVVVEVHLFDKDDIDRLNDIKIEPFDENTSINDVIMKIKEKLKQLLTAK